MKNLAKLFISILFITGLSACNQQELDNIKSQLDELKSTQIASINSQISNIQASITSLEKMDSELKSRIDELSKKEQELEDTDEEQAKELASLRETLTQLETSLSKRIDDLKTYVDEELKKQSDWVSATFSTLEQYQGTCTEIANIKQSISDLETSLKTLISGSESSINQTITSLETTLKALISDTESSIKSWVNEQLTGYYTIAQMDAKISALEKAITDGDDAQAAELDKLKTALETAKTDIKTAYEQAITDAITTSEGKINEKIAADIKTATDSLQSQINEINTKISAIETRLGIIEASLEKILAKVQSIVVVPTFSDGSVRLKDCEDTDILFEVSPRNAAKALAQQDLEVFSLESVSTETKSSMYVADFPIKSVKDNGECLVVTIDAAGLDMNIIDHNPTMSARLKIDDGISSMTSDYFSLYEDPKFATFPITGFRDLPDGRESATFVDDIGRIKAVVISNSALNNMASTRLMFVQDYSAGIALYCAAPHGYEFGDVLSIDLGGSTLTRYDGFMEITNLSLDKITKIGHKDVIDPIEVSIDDFLSNKYESRYVAIKDAQVVSEDLEKTWVVGSAGTQIGIECAGGSEFVVFSRKNATYGPENVPQGSGTIKGVATRYNDAIQLFFAQNSDWSGLVDTRFVLPEYEYYISAGPETKTAVSGSGIVWGAGDKVYLSDGSKSTVCTVPADYAGSTNATVKTKKKLEGEVLCIYPADAVTQEESVFYVDVPEDQGTDGGKYMVCSGSSTSSTIALSPRTALMKVKLSSDVEELSCVRITFEGAPVVGRMQIDGNGASVISGTQSVEVAAHGENDFYFTVLPASITKMDVDVVKADGSFGRKTSSGERTISAGNIYNLSINPATIPTVPAKRNWIELPEINTNGILAGTHGFFTRQMNSTAGVRNYSFQWSYGDYVSEWVAYPLNNALIGSGPRTNSFSYDPLLPQEVQPNIVNKSYGGGYLRGHQIPSADRLNTGDNATTFYATNMTPQISEFNSGIWAELESQVRQWALQSDTTYVVTGCVTEGGGVTGNTSGFNVRIPSAYYKAVIIYNQNTGYKGKAIILDHTAEVGQKHLADNMYISIDALEEILGIDLFYCLPEVVGEQEAAAIEAEGPKYIPAGAIDLGIVMTRADGSTYNLYWATSNLSDSGLCANPEDIGDYYAWGETTSKETFYWSNYKFGKWPLSKYNTSDGKRVLETGPSGDDAASKILGGKWRMPTLEECQALGAKCEWVLETINDVNGVLVGGKNGNIIFLPAAGDRTNEQEAGYLNTGRGCYWTSTADESGSNGAWEWGFSPLGSPDCGMGGNRYMGMSIRPVTE